LREFGYEVPRRILGSKREKIIYVVQYIPVFRNIKARVMRWWNKCLT
jgi:hypothetical protein